MANYPVCDEQFFIKWKLIDSCNFDCSYCKDVARNNHCIYVYDRLLAIINKIINLPHPEIFITLKGGEPTLHPFLYDIINKFLSYRNKKIYITLQTNGSAEFSYYLNLAKNFPAKSITFSIGIHSQYTDLQKIITIAAAMAENKQNVHFNFYNYDANNESNRRFVDALQKLRKIINFSFDGIESLNARSLAASDTAKIEFLDEINSQDIKKDTNQIDPAQINGMINPEEAGYCCHGANFLYIDADGHAYGTDCGKAVSPLPLWHEKATINYEKIFYCKNAICQDARRVKLPKFARKQDALDYLDQQQEKKKRWMYDSPFIKTGGKPDLKEIARARLKRLEIKLDGASSESAQPIWKRWDDAALVYEKMFVAQSREVFLHVIKGMEMGFSSIPDFPGTDSSLNELRPIWAEKQPLAIEIHKAVSLASLKKLAASIHGPLPRLEITLPNSYAEFLDCLLWLYEEFPGYAWGLGINTGWPVLKAEHQNQRLPHPRFVSIMRQAQICHSWPCPKISAIIVCENVQDTVGATIDSILAQNMDALEIIVIDNASNDATKDVLKRAASYAAGKIRIVRLKKRLDSGSAMRYGIDLAKGAAIVFIKPGEELAPGYLENAFPLLQDADIVAFVTSRMENGYEFHSWLEHETSSGADSFENWLKAWGNNFSLAAALFKSEFLILNNIMPSCGDGYPDFKFGSEAFLKSAKTVSRPTIGSFSLLNDNPCGFKAWTDALKFLAEILQDNDLICIDGRKSCEMRLYRCEAALSLAEIKQLQQQGQEGSLLTNERLRIVGASRNTLVSLLEDYAFVYCNKEKLRPEVAPRDLDWRNALTTQRLSKTFKPYGNADKTSAEHPRISIILPNFNKGKYIAACLDSIFAQGMTDFEVIAVDDCSTDESWTILQDYADFEPRLRLYRMDHNCRQGICRNIAIEKAAGEYLVFVDSDDILEENFLNYAYNEAKKENADIGVFAWKQMRDGNIIYRAHMEDANYRDGSGLSQYINTNINATVWAKIFKTEFVRSAGCKFEEYVYHQDNHFLASALEYAKNIIIRDFCAVIIVFSENSTVRPKTRRYLHIRSSLGMHNFLYGFYKRGYDCAGLESHANWHFTRMLLPAIEAFRQALGEMPLMDEDYNLVRENVLFIRELLKTFAKTMPSPLLERPVKFQASLLPDTNLARMESSPSLPANGSNGYAHSGNTGWMRLAAIQIQDHGSAVTQSCDGFQFYIAGENRLEKRDLMRAMAMLRADQTLDMICFAEKDGEEHGIYQGVALANNHCAKENFLLLPQFCVIRSSFLRKHGLGMDDYTGAEHILLLKALLKAQKVGVELPAVSAKNKPDNFANRVNWPDFALMVSDFTLTARQFPDMSSNDLAGLLCKLMSHLDFKLMLSNLGGKLNELSRLAENNEAFKAALLTTLNASERLKTHDMQSPQGDISLLVKEYLTGGKANA